MPQQITMGGACHNVTGHAAPTSQSTNALSSVYSTPATPTTPTAALYVPFFSEDMLNGAIGFNAARLAAGKPLYPLIARNDEQYDKLKNLLNSKVEQMTEKVSTLSEIESLFKDTPLYDKASANLKQFSLALEYLKHFDIKSNQGLAALRSGVDKLYVIGHGGPGDSALSSDPEGQSVVTANELADQLASGGLDPAFDDVRVIACFSADTELLTSFEPEALRRSAQTKVERHGFWGWLGYGTNTVEPFAQSLCNALKRAGFKQPKVSGYHGARVSPPKEHHHCHLLDTQGRLLDTEGSDVRASSVRHVFKPTV